MRYFIAHLLTGEAKNYHQALTRALAGRYRINPLHERVSPHITIKAPFDCDEEGIQEVERVLRAFAHNERAVPMTIQGFGRFGFKTAYLNVHKSPDAVSLVRRTLHALNENISWMPRYPLEGNKLHASVARFMNRVQSRRVARFLKLEHPLFNLSFDNVAILRKKERTWEVMTVIPFRAASHGSGYTLHAHDSNVRQEVPLVS